MRSLALAVLMVAAPTIAHADMRSRRHLSLNVGGGWPAGGFGASLQYGPVELTGEVGFAPFPWAFAASRDGRLALTLHEWTYTQLYLGGIAGLLDLTNDASLGDDFERHGEATIQFGGALLGFRINSTERRITNEFELGAIFGHCVRDAGCYTGDHYQTVHVAWRLHFWLL